MPHSTSSSVSKEVYVHDGTLDSAYVGELAPSSLDLPIEELRRRYHEEGYIFIKGFLPSDVSLKCREEYFKYLSSTDILEPGTKPVDGIFNSLKTAEQFPAIGVRTEESVDFMRLAVDAHKQPWYAKDLCGHSALLDFVSKLTGWGENTRSLTRTLLRNNVPNANATGLHYDQIFLRHGNATAVTAWVPLGGVKVEGGGLIYLEKGHILGEEIEKGFFDKAAATGLTPEEAKNAFNSNMERTGFLPYGPAEFSRMYNRRWLVADYEPGDVVFHVPYSIHASTINKDHNNTIRLATDLRFVDASKTWDERWSNYFELDDGL